MDVFEALYTTRAMRRVRPDPVPSDVQASILDAAIRAPTGGNAQNWRFLLVDDAEVIARLAPLYKAGIDSLWVTLYADRVAWAAEDPDDPERQAFLRVQRSAQWAADNFTAYPLLLFGFAQHDPTGGSIYPALWSAQLAARAAVVRTAQVQGDSFIIMSHSLIDKRFVNGSAVIDLSTSRHKTQPDIARKK